MVVKVYTAKPPIFNSLPNFGYIIMIICEKFWMTENFYMKIIYAMYTVMNAGYNPECTPHSKCRSTWKWTGGSRAGQWSIILRTLGEKIFTDQ